MSETSTKSFNQQAYLLYHWFYKKKDKLYEKNSGFGSKINNSKLRGTASVHRIVGNYTVPNFVPKIMSKSKLNLYKDFLNLETKKVTALVPHVKLYKVEQRSNKPFYFPNSSEMMDIHRLLQPGASMGGVGLKNFSMTFQGKDPFTRDKNIVCNLSIFMDSAELLFRPPPPGFAPLAELITISRNKFVPLKEGLSKQVSSDQVNRAHAHEIAVDVGYSIDDVSGLFSMEERSAIKNTNMFLRLNLTDHSININRDGTAELKASYIGRVSGVLADTTYNALFQSPDFLAIASAFSEKQDEADSQVNNTDRKKAQEDLKSEIKKETTTRLRSIFEYLDGNIKTVKDIKNSRIHNIYATKKNIAEYLDFVNMDSPGADLGGTRKPPEETPGSGTETPDEKEDASEEHKFEITDLQIDYIYMADLVESFIYNAKKNINTAKQLIKSDPVVSKTKKELRIQALQDSLRELSTFKVLFGSIVIPLKNNSAVSVNLADVPISLSLLQKYFFERIQQTYATKYTINNFLEDLVGKIYPMLFREHLYRDAPNMSIDSTVKTMMLCGEKTQKLSHSAGSDVDIRDLPDFLKNRNSLRRKKDDIDCFVVFVEPSSDDSVGLSGNVLQDTRNGVYHINLSKDRGLLKNISFSQVSQRFRREALMLESVSLYDELKMPYNANIEMVGNNLFLPGSTIYINPSSIGFGDPRNKRSSSARLGIGGYYVITSVTTTFNNGVLSTNMEAIFNSWPDSDKSMTPISSLFADSGIYEKAARIVNRRKNENGGG